MKKLVRHLWQLKFSYAIPWKTSLNNTLPCFLRITTSYYCWALSDISATMFLKKHSSHWIAMSVEITKPACKANKIILNIYSQSYFFPSLLYLPNCTNHFTNYPPITNLYHPVWSPNNGHVPYKAMSVTSQWYLTHNLHIYRYLSIVPLQALVIIEATNQRLYHRALGQWLFVSFL